MSDDTKSALCAACRVPIQGPSLEPSAIWSCPQCGVSDTYENVLKEVQDYMINQVNEVAFQPFRDAARRDPKHFTFKETPKEATVHRFIIDLDFKGG